MQVYIYALIDPASRLVRYVGKTENLDSRYQAHCAGSDSATGAWVRSITARPFLLILETVDEGMVPLKAFPWSLRPKHIPASTLAETKWIKRFRRTVINTRTKDNSKPAWDWLTNRDHAD